MQLTLQLPPSNPFRPHSVGWLSGESGNTTILRIETQDVNEVGELR